MRTGPVVVAAVVLAVSLMGIRPCRADLVISAPDITATPGSSGSFLVIITDTGPVSSFSVKSDTFQLALTPGQTDVTFTAAMTAPPGSSPAYIYSNSFANQFTGGSIDTQFPGTSFPTRMSFKASDSSSSSATPLNPGDSFALGLISYTVSASATLGSVIALDFGGAGNPNNSLSDGSSPPNSVAFTTLNGSITIMAVPEPESLSLLLSALTVCLVGRKLCRRGTTTAVLVPAHRSVRLP
jgi:hypothetical protein